MPSLLVFSITYVFVLSIVDHKERRFYAPVAQLGCFSQAFAFDQLYRLSFMPVVLLKFGSSAIMVIDGLKYIFAFLQYRGLYYSMLEPYLIFNGYSPHLYSKDPTNNQPIVNAENFNQAESVYFFDKFS